mmetsp:Transcript_103858/g.293734  ORF Transcript_103858/g.293734 Transcript_103858/m.293734 type:complete len:211 (-) Transcript_103858:382-1014(-)
MCTASNSPAHALTKLTANMTNGATIKYTRRTVVLGKYTVAATSRMKRPATVVPTTDITPSKQFISTSTKKPFVGANDRLGIESANMRTSRRHRAPSMPPRSAERACGCASAANGTTARVGACSASCVAARDEARSSGGESCSCQLRGSRPAPTEPPVYRSTRLWSPIADGRWHTETAVIPARSQRPMSRASERMSSELVASSMSANLGLW